MDVRHFMKMVRKAYGIKYTEIAKGTGQSPQNLQNKIANNSLRAAELFQIAEMLGADVKFVDKDTGKILI